MSFWGVMRGRGSEFREASGMWDLVLSYEGFQLSRTSRQD